VTRFLAVQHTFSEFFGALEPQWEMRDIAFNDVRTVAGQDVAGTPSQFDALWLLGAAWPIADAGRWIAFRAPLPGYGLLFRPELKPGMLEDMVMEEGREMPEDTASQIATAREEWDALQAASERVTVALVQALDLMRERRKAPVFRLSVQR